MNASQKKFNHYDISPHILLILSNAWIGCNRLSLDGDHISSSPDTNNDNYVLLKMEGLMLMSY